MAASRVPKLSYRRLYDKISCTVDDMCFTKSKMCSFVQSVFMIIGGMSFFFLKYLDTQFFMSVELPTLERPLASSQCNSSSFAKFYKEYQRRVPAFGNPSSKLVGHQKFKYLTPLDIQFLNRCQDSRCFFEESGFL